MSAPIRAVVAFPGDLDTPTGGYAYCRAVLARLPRHGVEARPLSLPASFPAPDAGDAAEAIARLGAVEPGTALLVDGLAYGALPPAALDALARPIVALVHHPLGLEAGLAPERAQALLASEAAALARAARIVAASPTTARVIREDFGIAPERIAVALPGTEKAPRAKGTANGMANGSANGLPGAPLEILALGAVVPRKGFDLLVRALAPLVDLRWRLTIAGPIDRDADCVLSLRATIAEAGLADRVIVTGTLDEAARDAVLDAADLFVSPSLYEGYGMALAEAMARGLPIVASTGGAAHETVPDEAAVKVPPGDVAALTGALAQVLEEPRLRARLAEASFAAGARLPTFDDTTRIIAEALRASLAHASDNSPKVPR